MTSDEEKDPPVPADVEGRIPKQVHGDHAAEKHDAHDHEALADEPND